MISDTRIQELLADLDDGLDRQLILSPQWYCDPEIFDVEQQVVFRHTWQYVGSTVSIPGPGDYLTDTIGGVPIVVVRDKSGQLRGFINVCRHRASLIAKGQGTATSLQCSYHGWTWNLNGELIGVPRANREPNFTREEYPLLPIAVDTWNQLIFVNIDGDAPSLESQIGGLKAQVEAEGLDMLQYEIRPDSPHNQNDEVATNWKLLAENNIECYHCATVHSDSTQFFCMSNPDDYATAIGSTWAFQHLKTKELAEGQPIPYPLFGPMQFATFYPNLQIMFYPQSMSVSNFRPIAPGLTRWRRDMFYIPGTRDEDIAASAEWFKSLYVEDVESMTSTFAGHSSGLVRGGPLFLDSEMTIRSMHMVLRDAFAAELARRNAIARTTAEVR